MAKVMVAVSGGVDSAVAASRLVAAGHDVTAVHLKLADLPGHVEGQGCCSLDDASDARRVAQVLEVPFYVWDMREVFEREVQGPFAAAYASGRTPNPCITCNEKVKYAALLERATSLGFDALATGHHVRLRHGGRPGDGASADELSPTIDPGPGARMFRAVDDGKDQSYVLHVATDEQLARSLFPVGESTKAEVRAEAEALGLRVANKPDSYDVCFIPDGDTGGYLGRVLEPEPGDIVDQSGKVLGTHLGAWRYTVGQRRGLGLDHHERRFVLATDVDKRTVVVGDRDALACRWIELGAVNWIGGDAPTGEGLTVQLRAHGRPIPGRVVGGQRVELDEPAHGVAVGQAAVIHLGEECLGGGWIESAERAGLPIAAGS